MYILIRIDSARNQTKTGQTYSYQIICVLIHTCTYSYVLMYLRSHMYSYWPAIKQKLVRHTMSILIRMYSHVLVLTYTFSYILIRVHTALDKKKLVIYTHIKSLSFAYSYVHTQTYFYIVLHTHTFSYIFVCIHTAHYQTKIGQNNHYHMRTHTY